MSVCLGCRMAADEAKGLTGSANHDPTFCVDLAIQPHGCPCQHDKAVSADV